MARFESKYDVGALVEVKPDLETDKSVNRFGFVRALKFANDNQAYYDIELCNTAELVNTVPEPQVLKQVPEPQILKQYRSL